MNILPIQKQVLVISCLVEGNSIRATERLTGVHRDTIMRLGVRVGEACDQLHDELMRYLHCNILQLDELWSYVGKKQKRLREDDDSEELGDQYTYVALDATRKAIVSYLVGKRSADNTCRFVADVSRRILTRPQITSDGFKPYVEAVELSFGADVDFAQLVKTYDGEPARDAARRYSPGWIIDISQVPIMGKPDPDEISTSFVERQNLTVRMHVRRFTRLTNAFSKRLRNHRAAFALHVAYYNLCRVHETLRVTPGMALGVTSHVWSVRELLERSVLSNAA